MEFTTGWIAGIVLVLLWAGEATAPGLMAPAQTLRQRSRHLALGLLNVLVSATLVAALALADARAAFSEIGVFRLLEAPGGLEFLGALVLLDLWHYATHVVAHHVPVLWRFHAVHHNADRLDATVAMRFHMVEIAWLGLTTIPFAVALGIPIEHVAAYNAILIPASLFHHADLAVPARLERFLKYAIVTPRMHWVHHSRWAPETNSNYGAVLPVWDRLFGTYRQRAHPETIVVGLDGFTTDEIEQLTGMLMTPFGSSVSGYGSPPREYGDDGQAEPARQRMHAAAHPH